MKKLCLCHDGWITTMKEVNDWALSAHKELYIVHTAITSLVHVMITTNWYLGNLEQQFSYLFMKYTFKTCRTRKYFLMLQNKSKLTVI